MTGRNNAVSLASPPKSPSRSRPNASHPTTRKRPRETLPPFAPRTQTFGVSGCRRCVRRVANARKFQDYSSGIGFIGGGIIFMRRDVVRGLTTAASVWLTAALGMACGAGLPVLAVATTVGYFIIMLIFPKLLQYLPRERRTATMLRISYKDGLGLLRTFLIICSKLRFVIDRVEVERKNSLEAREELDDLADFEGVEPERLGEGVVVLTMQVKGKKAGFTPHRQFSRNRWRHPRRQSVERCGA
jgi:MgtC family